MNQETNLNNYDDARVKADISKVKTEKEEMLIERLEEVKNSADEKLKRCIELACEKGSGAWLSALPLQAMGFVLNKQEFRDGIYLRYGWRIPNTPTYCACGTKNSVDHTLNCKLGGYVTMRHNNVRDLEASMLKEVCKDVKSSPSCYQLGPLRFKVRMRLKKHDSMCQLLVCGVQWRGLFLMYGFFIQTPPPMLALLYSSCTSNMNEKRNDATTIAYYK